MLVAASLRGGEIVVGTPVVSRREAPHLLYTVEEPLHEIALTVDPAAEAECLLSVTGVLIPRCPLLLDL